MDSPPEKPAPLPKQDINLIRAKIRGYCDTLPWYVALTVAEEILKNVLINLSPKMRSRVFDTFFKNQTALLNKQDDTIH